MCVLEKDSKWLIFSLKYNENTFLAKVACALQGCSEVAETAMIITRMIMTVTECIRFNWVDK